MPRPRIYESNAEKQAEYRRRKALPGVYGLAEKEAIIHAAWALYDAVSAAADLGDSEAVRLNGLSPSQIINALAERIRSRS